MLKFTSIFHSYLNVSPAIPILVLVSVSILASSSTRLPRFLKKFTFLRLTPPYLILTFSSLLLFVSPITCIFFMLIFSLYRWYASFKPPTNICMFFSASAIKAVSSANLILLILRIDRKHVMCWYAALPHAPPYLCKSNLFISYFHYR